MNTLSVGDSNNKNAFGLFIKGKREVLGKSIRGLASELDMTAAYLSDIEKGNRYAPQKHLGKLVTLFNLSGDELNTFYELAGKSRKNLFPDLTDYIGENELARVALRTAKEVNLTDSGWEEIISHIKHSPERE